MSNDFYTDLPRISIFVDNCWAGSGRMVDERIEDCSARLEHPNFKGDIGSENERIYDALDLAISEGYDEIELKDGRTISWKIEETEE